MKTLAIVGLLTVVLTNSAFAAVAVQNIPVQTPKLKNHEWSQGSEPSPPSWVNTHEMYRNILLFNKESSAIASEKNLQYWNDASWWPIWRGESGFEVGHTDGNLLHIVEGKR